MQFKSEIIEEFADRLYKEASHTISSYIFGYAVVLMVIGALFAFSKGGGWPIVLLTGIIGATIGYYHGKEKAFQLRLQAQTALCQLQIEKNTRR